MADLFESDESSISESTPASNSPLFDASIDSTNPYAKQLQDLLKRQTLATTKASTERSASLKAATERLLARSQNTGVEDAAMYFRLAGALGKPTRTGGFGESLGNFSEALAPELEKRSQRKRDYEDLMEKYKLQASAGDVNDLNEQIKLTSQLGKLHAGKRSPIAQMMAERDQYEKTDPRWKVLDDAITKSSTHPGSSSKPKEPEVITLQRIADDTSQPPSVRKAATAQIRKLNNFKDSTGTSEPKEPKPQSPAGKLAADKGFKPGTPEYQAEVDKILKAGTHLGAKDKDELYNADAAIKSSTSALLLLNKALSINKKAYEGATAGARRTIARNLPGFKSSEGVKATTELENILTRQAVGSLKATFGGNPSDAEARLLLRLEGAIDMSTEERDALIQESITAAVRRLKDNKEKVKSIRSGAFDLDRSSPDEKAKGGRIGYAHGGYATEEQDMRGGGAVNMRTGGRPMTDTSGDYSAANFGRAIGQGLGMSFGDEAIARVRAMMEDRPYEQIVQEERAAYEAFAKKHPGSALTTELVSGLLPTAASMLIPGGQAAGAANVVRMAPTVAKLAGTSALQGGISGFGAGQGGVGNRLQSAAEGAATSAVLGPAIAKTGTVIGKGMSAAKNALRPSEEAVSERATRKVLEAMGRDEMDVNAVRQRMARDRKLDVKSSLADASPSTASLAEAVVTRPGAGRKKLGSMYEERLAEGRESVGQKTQKSIGKGVDYTDEESSLIGKLRGNARTMYDKAYALGEVDDPRISRVLEDNTFRDAYAEARLIIGKEAKAAELRGEDASKYQLKQIYKQDADGNYVRTGEVPDVQTLDYIKRGIDALIDKGFTSGKGMSKAEANALKDLKNAYVGVIDDVTKVNGVSPYAQARATYKGDAETLDALRFGRTDYLSPKFTPKEVLNKVATMSQGEQDALRAGVAQSILGKIMESPQQINAAQRVIGAPSTRKRLEGLFKDPNEYKLFEEALHREAQLFRNAQDAIRNSRTANKQEALADLKKSSTVLDVAGDVVDLTTAGPGSMVGRVLKFLQSRTSLDEKTASKLADMLKASSVKEIDDVLNSIEKSSGAIVKKASKTGRREKAVSSAIARSIGEPSADDVEEDESTPLPVKETEQQVIDRLMGESANTNEDERVLQQLMEKYANE